ncbi:MAG: hypothetical protein IJ468_08585 [Lachnospiraceae bacterium]|nr:hypothetical protein [Lachnospiraceae bacterium]
MATHHSLDIKPVPENVLYINETTLADLTAPEVNQTRGRCKSANQSGEPGAIPDETDNVRVYLPLDINRQAVIRRLQDVYMRYGCPSGENEFCFKSEINRIISQLEIYDQVWFVRRGDCGNGHSENATELVKEVIRILEIEEGCAESFPYETIEQLRKEYGL